MAKKKDEFAGTNVELEKMLKSYTDHERAPVTVAQFKAYNEYNLHLFNTLQQQIIGLDVALGLMMETFVPKEEHDIFKAEVKKRVEAIAEGIAAQQKTEEKKIALA